MIIIPVCLNFPPPDSFRLRGWAEWCFVVFFGLVVVGVPSAMLAYLIITG